MAPPSSRFILVVDDHISTAQITARLIRARGFLVLTAGSVAEARRLASEHEIGFLVSDLGLPDGDGCELMAGLHREQGIRGATISGYGMEVDHLRSREAGFVMHLVKPIQVQNLDELLVVARRALDEPAPPWPGVH